jgi:nitrate reductase delta subunit
MLRTVPGKARQPEFARQIKAWTRERFALGEDDVVMVSEIACGLPGCPPLETVVTFWTASDMRHAFKVFKPVDGVTVEDLPPYWMKNAIVSDGSEFSCC